MADSGEQPERRLEAVPRRSENADIETARLEPAPQPLNWSSIWAGLFVAVGVQTALRLFGASLGFSLLGGTAAPTNAIIWAGISLVLSLFAGGYLVGLLSAKSVSASTGAWHGVVLWGLVILSSLVFTITGAAGAVGFLGAFFTPQAAGIGNLLALLALLAALATTVLASAAGQATTRRSQQQ